MVEGWSVQEAAVRLLCSEATVRRRLASDDDPLVAVDGSRRVRVTRESLEAAQHDMLRRMGLVTLPPTTDTQPSSEMSTGGPDHGSAEVARLQARVSELEGALSDLTAAHSAVLDTYRRLSDGARPNN